MSDPAFIASAYAIVLGGLALYVTSLLRRLRAARRTADALGRERPRHRGDSASATDGSEPVAIPE